MKFSSPKALNLEALILSQPEHLIFRRVTRNGKRKFEEVPTKSKSLLKHVPYCYYIIDLIIQRSTNSKNLVHDYVNLRSELINKIIPNHTRIMILSLLEGLGVIQINHSYKFKSNQFNSLYGDNTFSKSYRLNPSYDLTDLNSIEFEKGHYIGDTDNISL